MDKLAEIHNKLEYLRKELDAKRAIMKHNRKAAIDMCHFLYDIINAIAPGKIYAGWSGSHSNPEVANYPVVTIYAVCRSGCITISEWCIDTSGENPPPTITEDDVINSVLEGLSKITL